MDEQNAAPQKPMKTMKTQYSYEVHMWGTGKVLRSEWRDSATERDRAAEKTRANEDFHGYEIRLIQRNVPIEDGC